MNAPILRVLAINPSHDGLGDDESNRFGKRLSPLPVEQAEYLAHVSPCELHGADVGKPIL